MRQMKPWMNVIPLGVIAQCNVGTCRAPKLVLRLQPITNDLMSPLNDGNPSGFPVVLEVRTEKLIRNGNRFPDIFIWSMWRLNVKNKTGWRWEHIETDLMKKVHEKKMQSRQIKSGKKHREIPVTQSKAMRVFAVAHKLIYIPSCRRKQGWFLIKKHDSPDRRGGSIILKMSMNCFR